ncbi:ATP-binding cassette sub-family B member 10, mitochondrial [Camelus ferus]|nr:ATP-binding cassette sub-family B member 10, mitochondrial [Camelus ferus]
MEGQDLRDKCADESQHHGQGAIQVSLFANPVLHNPFQNRGPGPPGGDIAGVAEALGHWKRVITMSAPFFLGKVIDVIYTNPTVDYSYNLTHLCLVLSGVFLCGAAANAVRVYLMQTSAPPGPERRVWPGAGAVRCVTAAALISALSRQRIVNRLRASLFSSVLRQEVAFFDKTRTGELINRLSSDTALLGRSVTENLSDGLRAGAQASVGIGMMEEPLLHTQVDLHPFECFVSPNLATFVLSVVPPISILAVIYGRYLRKLTKVTQDSLAQATQLAEERIGNIRTVRAFGKEITEIEKYTSNVDHVMQLARKEAFARAGFFGATGLSGNLIVLSVLYKGGLLMGSAHMTVGELSSFLMYAFWVGLSVGGLSSFYSELMKGLGAGGRLWELLEREPALPFNGTISLDGRDIRQLNPVWLRSKIGTVSQEPILFSCSIAENIAYGADDPSLVTAAQVEKVACAANAAAFIRNFPQGFNTVVGEKGVLLSGPFRYRDSPALFRSGSTRGFGSSACKVSGLGPDWFPGSNLKELRTPAASDWGPPATVLWAPPGTSVSTTPHGQAPRFDVITAHPPPLRCRPTTPHGPALHFDVITNRHHFPVAYRSDHALRLGAAL